MPRALRVRLVAAALALVATPAGAREPRTLALRFPRVTVPAGGDTELCVFVRVPLRVPFDLESLEIRHRGVRPDFSPRHFLVYLYTGERLADFAREAGRVVQSRACLDFGPSDRDRRLLIAAGIGNPSRRALPRGLAQPLAPVAGTPGGAPEGLGFVLDAEWVNASSRARRGSTRVILRRARPKRIKRRLLPIAERTAELGLRVPPSRVLSTEASTAALNAVRFAEAPLLDAWGAGIATTGSPAPSGDACVLLLSAHMHKRAKFFAVDVIGADGRPESVPGGVPNPFEPGRSHLFGTADYTDPGTLPFFPPRLLRAGERVHYACWVDNGVTTVVRFGCEETPGEPPGEAAGFAGGPAKPCTVPGVNPGECPGADAAYPGRTFTGACVPAHAVAGPSPDDEACVLTGFYFDAVPGAPAGSECDASRL